MAISGDAQARSRALAQGKTSEVGDSPSVRVRIGEAGSNVVRRQVWIVRRYLSAAAIVAASIRVEFEKQGSTIGPLDVLIAGTAVSRGAALVTNNATEFSRVPGLRVLDWKSA